MVAARKEGLTVGQWLERRVREWTEAGSPIPVAAPARRVAGRAGAVDAGRAGLAEAANVPVPEPLARSALATLGRAVRQARGLPPPKPRRKPPLAIEGA